MNVDPSNAPCTRGRSCMPCLSCYAIKNKGTADECRFVTLTHRKVHEERKAHPHQPLRQLTPPTCMALAIRGYLCSIPLRGSGAINTELVRTETNSGHSEFVRVSFQFVVNRLSPNSDTEFYMITSYPRDFKI